MQSLFTHKASSLLTKVVVLLAGLFTGVSAMANTISSTATGGNWNATNTWVGGTVPTAADDVVIVSGANVTVSNIPTTSGWPIKSTTANVKNLDVRNNAKFAVASGHTLNIWGSFVNTNAALYTLQGTVNFAGENQNIPSFTYSGLTVSGSAAAVKTLAGPVTVTAAFTLSGGVVKTTTDNLLTIDVTGSLDAPNSASYVSGPISRKTNSASEYFFPIGNGSLRPVTVRPQSAQPGEYLVNYNQQAPEVDALVGGLGGILVNEYWDVTRNAGPDAVVSIFYVRPNNTSAWYNETEPCENCSVAVVQSAGNFTTNVWNFTGADSPGFNDGESTPWKTNARVSSKMVSGFGKFGFGFTYVMVLPLTLEKFNAAAAGADAILDWTFAGASDLASTSVEQSNDGLHFNTLTTITAVEGRNSYRYTDRNLAAGNHYYRLAIKNKNGKTGLSKTVLVSAGKPRTAITGLRPTVVTGTAIVDIYAAVEQNCMLLVTDMSGRQVINKQLILLQGNNNCRFDASALAKGFYSVVVKTSDGTIASLKMIRE